MECHEQEQTADLCDGRISDSHCSMFLQKTLGDLHVLHWVIYA